MWYESSALVVESPDDEHRCSLTLSRTTPLSSMINPKIPVVDDAWKLRIGEMFDVRVVVAQVGYVVVGGVAMWMLLNMCILKSPIADVTMTRDVKGISTVLAAPPA